MIIITSINSNTFIQKDEYNRPCYGICILHAMAYATHCVQTEAERHLKKTDAFRSRDCQREVKKSLAVNYKTMKEEGRKERYRR